MQAELRNLRSDCAQLQNALVDATAAAEQISKELSAQRVRETHLHDELSQAMQSAAENKKIADIRVEELEQSLEHAKHQISSMELERAQCSAAWSARKNELEYFAAVVGYETARELETRELELQELYSKVRNMQLEAGEVGQIGVLHEELEAKSQLVDIMRLQQTKLESKCNELEAWKETNWREVDEAHCVIARLRVALGDEGEKRVYELNAKDRELSQAMQSAAENKKIADIRVEELE